MSKFIEKMPPKTPLSFFWYITKPHLGWATAAVIFVTLASATSQGSSYFFKLIVDAVEAGNIQQALWWGMAYPVAIFFVQLLFRASGICGAYWTNHARKTGVDTVNQYLLGHSHTYFTNRFAGSVTNKVRNVVDAAEHAVPDFLWAHLNSLVGFLVTFLLISMVDLTAGLIFILLVIILIVINRAMAPEKAVRARANADASSVLQGRLVDTIGNVTAVRQYAKTKDELSTLAELTEHKRFAGMRNWLYTEYMLLINSIILFIFSLGIFWVLIDRWSSGAIGTGDFVLVLALVSQITGTMLFIGRAFNTTARMLGEMREGLEDIMTPYGVVDKDGAQPLRIRDGEVAWQDVSFGFGENVIFDEFSLTIPAKQKLGLVGTSGAGKSTFVSLLLRQHDLDGGVITIDDQDISKITQHSLREQIAVIPQEPALFHRSLRDNIAYAKPSATQEEVEEVAKMAQAHEFIIGLPDGYNTLVGERGVKLSGGQRQRIAIARAMLKNAPILILDEATSALDSESEVVIQKALHILMQGKTVIAIAHRLSTLREMDRIVVLEEGQVIEDGTHEELRGSGGVYQRLWKHQSGGFLHD